MSFDLKIKNGDLVIENGLLAEVSNTEKLVQDILKICLTEANSNPLYPWYGSYVSKSLIGNHLDLDIVFQMADSQLKNALNSLKQLQDVQLRSGQPMSASEQIAAIINVYIIRNKYDPRQFDVQIQVLSRGLNNVPVNFNISA